MKKRFTLQLLFIVAFLALSFCDTLAETVTIESPEWKVDFNDQTGAITAISVHGEVITAEACDYMPFDVNQGEKDTRNEKWVAYGKTQFLGLEKVDSQTVVTRWRAGEGGDWIVDLEWLLDPEKNMLGRRMRVRWDGADEVKIRALWWRFPTLACDDSAYFYIPGRFPPQKSPISALTQRASAWERPGIVQLTPNRTAVFFMDYTDKTLDAGSTEIIQKDLGTEKYGVQVSQVFSIMGRMKKGTSQELGTSWMWVLPTDGEATLLKMHAGYEAIGLTVPKNRPTEFQNLLLYSFHPGGSIGSNMQDLGGFQPAVSFVDRIASTGANAVWMLPIESNGIYWPNDYYRFQDGLGTGDDYRALVKRLHESGMYVMQDCVPHGGSNRFDRAKEHPEWLTYDEDGSTFDYWCFDFNYPTWRQYMKNVAIYYMKKYGVDGYRIDAVGGSKVPNWHPDIPYERASFAKLQAGFNMQRSIREGVKEVNPVHGGTLAEVGDDYFGIVSDAVYDFSGCYHVFHAGRGGIPAQYVRDLRRWLYECQHGSLKGLLRLRHSESHDALRSQLWYGTQPARAIVALTAFIDGIPLLYQGQEVGNLETYARIFAVRKALPEMQNAGYDYVGIDVPDGVFAVGYEKDGLRSVGMINFNDTPVTFRLAVNQNGTEDVKDVKFVTDMFCGKTKTVENGTVSVTLSPFDFTVYALRPLNFTPPVIVAGGKPEKQEAPENAVSGAVRTLTGNGWQAEINDATGLISSMTRNGVRLLGKMNLDIHQDVKKLLEQRDVEFLASESSERRLAYRLKFADVSVRFEYVADGESLQFSAMMEGEQNENSWKNALQTLAVNFSCPGADIWSANTAEGVLRDRIFFRTDKKINVNARHGIYWRPLELDVLYDSCYQPLWCNATMKAEWVENAVTFAFRENTLPARVRWLNRDVEGQKVLTASLSLLGPLNMLSGSELKPIVAVTITPRNVPEKVTEKPAINLRPTFGGWCFENDHYVINLSRFGTIQRFVSKKSGENVLFSHGNLYTDYGFGTKGSRYSNENEVETWSRIETLDSHTVRLHFEGRLRMKDRFGRCPKTVAFVTEYTLDNSDTLTVRSLTDAPSVKDTDTAFMAWMMSMPTADGFAFRKDGKVVAEGHPLETKGRSVMTKTLAATLGGMPDELELRTGGTPILVIHGFQRDRIQNLFIDRTNLFFAFYDGDIPPEKPMRQDFEWKMTVK